MSTRMFAPASKSCNTEGNRTLWGRMFGRMVQGAREKKSCSVEAAAQLAGMTTAEWEAVEAGQVPETRARLQALAAGLEMDMSHLGLLVLFCREAWGL